MFSPPFSATDVADEERRASVHPGLPATLLAGRLAARCYKSIEYLGISLYTSFMSAIPFRLVTKDDLERSLKELEYRLVIRLGSMIVVAIGVNATLVKLL